MKLDMLISLLLLVVSLYSGFVETVCTGRNNMWHVCLGGNTKNPVPYAITSDEYSKDVYVCGTINTDTYSYY